MGAEIKCCECQRLVPEDEIESGSDGRPMCCCCRLKELDAKLAEDDCDERTHETVKETAGLATEVSVAARSSAPPEPAHADWAGIY
jgi:hypothetical protein